jgi:hypothetical protein
MNKRNVGMWKSMSMLVLGSQFTKLFMNENPFLLSHAVITPMLFITKKRFKLLLEIMFMVTHPHGTYSISHAYLAYAKMDPQVVFHCCFVASQKIKNQL